MSSSFVIAVVLVAWLFNEPANASKVVGLALIMLDIVITSRHSLTDLGGRMNNKLIPFNNPAENAIRPFVIGRKNWLPVGSSPGTKGSAMIYTQIETAKANLLESRQYLEQLFEHLPEAKTEADLKELLP